MKLRRTLYVVSAAIAALFACLGWVGERADMVGIDVRRLDYAKTD